MVTKKTPPTRTVTAVTHERASRLHRLLRLLSGTGQTRAALLRRLGLNVRGFYRDLETLRHAGIVVQLVKDRYSLTELPGEALERLPFPDPGLSIGEARQLAQGRSPAHKKLQDQLKRLEK